MADITPIASLNGEISPIASLTGELAMPEKVRMQGPPGAAATVTVGTVTTGEPGTDAIVTNSGTENAAVLNFTIPKGETGAVGAVGTQGPKGDKGDPGPAGAGFPDGGAFGQLLSKTESGTAWIDPPQSCGGGGGGVLIVNITNGPEVGSLVADKTVAEIVAAAHTQLVFAQYSDVDTSGNGDSYVISGPLERIQTERANGKEMTILFFAGYWYDSKEGAFVGGITGVSANGVDQWVC